MKKSVKSHPKKLIVRKSSTYEKDFHQWSLDQAKFLRKKEFCNLDIEHLVEEIETLSASDKRAVESHLAILLIHLLKIKYQPEKHGKSWDLTIKEAKFQIKKILKNNPSFIRLMPEFFRDAYETARRGSAYETGLDEKIFPKKCPWKIEEVL